MIRKLATARKNDTNAQVRGVMSAVSAAGRAALRPTLTLRRRGLRTAGFGSFASKHYSMGPTLIDEHYVLVAKAN